MDFTDRRYKGIIRFESQMSDLVRGIEKRGKKLEFEIILIEERKEEGRGPESQSDF